MNIAVFEENDSDFLHLKTLLNKYSGKNGLNFEIYHYNSFDSISGNINSENISLYILNVEDNDLSGLKIAKMLIPLQCKNFIFTSKSTYCAFFAFEVNAIHYLLKPVKYEDLCNAFSRCPELFEKFTALEVKIGHNTVHIPQSSINYIEVWNKVVSVHTEKSVAKTYTTLEKIYSKLDSNKFIRPQRSFIVNMNYIADIQKDKMILNNDMEITLKREERSNIKLKYQEFIFKTARQMYKEGGGNPIDF